MNFYRLLSTTLLLISIFTTGLSISIHFLNGNRTDYCYAEPFITKRVECLEPLMTLYYGEYLTIACPNLANWIAEEKCEGCPWSKINATAITPADASALDRSQLFEAAQPSCSVSQYLLTIISKKNSQHLSFFGFAVPLFSAMFLAMTNNRTGSPTTPLVFGSKMNEPLLFVSLWVLFFVGYGLSVAGHEIHSICEGPFSFTSLLIGDWVNLAIMLWTSWWRCRYLEAPNTPEEVISWAAYRRSSLYRKSALWQQRLVDFICWSAPILILLSVLFEPRYSTESLSVCETGSYRFAAYGLTQYSKLVLTLIAIGIYSFGPPSHRILFYARYLFLIIVLVLSISLLFVMRSPIYQPQCFSTLIPHVSDCQIAGPLDAVLIAHSFSIALLGLAEPLRLGWPQPRKQKINVGDSKSLDVP